MLYSSTEVTELVCTRISHDLIGNIGAMSNGLEILGGEGEVIDDETKNILQTAVDILKYRQKFFRMAFGVPSYQTKAEEVLQVCNDYVSTIGSKSYSINVKISQFASEIARYICLCVMIAADVCVRGGNIEFSADNKHLCVAVSSDYDLSAAKIEKYESIIKNVRQDKDSQYAPLIYLQALLGENVPLVLEKQDKKMSLTIG